MKLIIDNRTDLPMDIVLHYVLTVVSEGRISNNGKEYCYATKFIDDIMVVSVKNKNSDRLIIYKD